MQVISFSARQISREISPLRFSPLPGKFLGNFSYFSPPDIIPSSDRARRRIFAIRPKGPAALSRGPVHVRVILPRCTRKVARRGLVLVVKHKLALGLLGCGPGARALVLTLGRTEMSTACHRSPVFCLPRSFISASFVVRCMANFSEISPHFFPHGKFQ